MSHQQTPAQGLVAVDGVVALHEIGPAMSFKRPKIIQVIEYTLLMLSMSSLIIAGGLSASFSISRDGYTKLIFVIVILLVFDVLATLLWVLRGVVLIERIGPLSVPLPLTSSTLSSSKKPSTGTEDTAIKASASGVGSIAFDRDSRGGSLSPGSSSSASWLQFPAVVIDAGSSACRFGFGTPVAKSKGSIANVCGIPRRRRGSGVDQQHALGGVDLLGVGELLIGRHSARRRGVVVGDAAFRRAEISSPSEGLDLIYPIQEGCITDWDAMESMWAHIFEKELCVNPSKQPTLISWSPRESKENAERAAELLFEKFNMPAIYLGVSPVLALYSVGDNSGCVLESGDGATHACCVIDGFAYPAATVRSPVSGRSTTTYLQELLRLRGYHFTSIEDVMRIRDIKESICYCATEYDGEVKLAMERNRVSAVLPDGTPINLERERIQVAELLFRPSLSHTTLVHRAPSEASGSFLGLQHAVAKAISNCHEDIRGAMWSNIVLSGGNTSFPFLLERLQSDLSKTASSLGHHCKVMAPDSRDQMVWLGGAVLAALGESFVGNWIERSEYEENGGFVVHAKCQTALISQS